MSAFPVAALTDHSGTTSSTPSASLATSALANGGRQYLLFQNVSDTTIWVNIGPPPLAATTSQPSIQVIAGASLEFSGPSTGVVPTGAVHVACTVASKAFTLKTA